MVPGWQPDGISQLTFLFMGCRACWQTTFYGDSEIYRKANLTLMISLFYSYYIMQLTLTY